MSTFIEPERDYKFSDARLIEIALEKIAFAQRDATELATVGVTAAWVDDLEDIVEAFGNLPSDEVELGEQEEATTEKNTDADLLRDKLKELRSAAQRAFGEKHADYKQFGLKGLDDMNDAQLLKTGMVAHGVAVSHATPLATKGWDAADNTELKSLTDDLAAGLKNQSIEIGSRDNATENRILKGNELYGLLENELCEAGKSYWRTLSEAKYNDYIIYNTPSGGSSGSGGTSTSEGNVNMGTVSNVDVSAINVNDDTTVRTEGSGNVIFIYASATAGEAPGATVWEVVPGTDVTQLITAFATVIGITEEKRYINVYCPGPLTGHFKITFTNIL